MGLDIWAPQGAPVISQYGGVVTRAYTSGSAAGNAVVIKYTDGPYKGYEVRYYHLSAFGDFRAGQPVKAGDVVGYVGKTGAGGRPLSTGPHLHFEVRDPTGRVVNPNTVLGVDPRQPHNAPFVAGKAGPTTETTQTAQPSTQQSGPEVTPEDVQQEKDRRREELYKQWRLDQDETDKRAEEAETRRALNESLGQPRSKVSLNVNVRGPSGVDVKTDADGVFDGNTTVTREKLRETGRGDLPRAA
jgi:hypothetical protein